MTPLSKRLEKLEGDAPSFEVRIGCKTCVGTDQAEHVLGYERRITEREPGETHQDFLNRVRVAAAQFNRETFPHATIILEGDAAAL